MIHSVFPCGLQRGTSFDLTISGENLSEPIGLVTSFPAKVSFSQSKNSSNHIQARVEVPADAPAGWHTIRLRTSRGLSNLRPFCIDELPQVVRSGSPHSTSQAQKITLPCVICGTIGSDQADYYAVDLQPGQRLCAEILGRRLGSSLDPALSLLDATGQQLEFSDDAPGLQKDARFIFVPKIAGRYHIEVRDVRAAGGADCHYRLRLGDFPLSCVAFPLAIKRGTSAKVRFAGPLVDDVEPVEITAPADQALDALAITPRFANRPGSQAGWPVQVGLSDLHEVIEYEPNESPTQPNVVPVPGAVSARFDKKGDKDHFHITLMGGVRYLLNCTSQDLGSPAMVQLTLCNTKGEKLSQSNPETAHTLIDYTPPYTGEFILAVEHSHNWGGPDQAYRICIEPHRSRFRLTALHDRVELPAGSTTLLTIQAERQGYAGPIELRITQPKDVSGTATIPAGSNAAFLPLTIPKSTALATSSLIVEGKTTDPRQPMREPATITPMIKQAFSDLSFLPMTLDRGVTLNIQHPAPFRFIAEPIYPHAIRGLPVPIQIKVQRDPGFEEEITIASVHLPDQQSAPPALVATVAKGQNEAKADLRLETGVGETITALTAKAQVNGHQINISTLSRVKFGPFCSLSLSASSIKPANMGPIAKGYISPYRTLDLLLGPLQPQWSGLDMRFLPEKFSTTAIEIEVTRQGGYLGPVQLRLQNLPDGVSAGSVLLPAGHSRAILPVIVKPDRKAMKGEAKVIAVAPGLPQAEVPSGPVTVIVDK